MALSLGAAGLLGGLSAVGSIGSGLFSNAMTGKQQRRAYEYARALQQQQYDLNQRSLRESSGNLRKGLSSAGYNPMLAVSQATQSPTVSGGTPVSSNATDVSGFRDAFNNLANTLNQTAQTRATVDNLDSQTGKNVSETTAQNIRNKFLNQREASEIKKIVKETNFMDAQVANWDAQLRMQEKVAQIGANASRYGSDTALKGSIYNADTQRAMNKLTNEINEVNNIRTNKTNSRYKHIQGFGFGYSGY